MNYMKPKKKKKERPSLMRKQQREARDEIKATGIKTRVVSTLPRKMTPYDTALRRLQKRRVNAKAVLSMLKSKDPVLRKAAGERLSDKKVLKNISLPKLRKLAKSKNWRVRRAAMKGLAQKGEKGLSELRELAKDKNEFVQRNAKFGLVDVFVKKGDLLELRELAKSPDVDIHRGAVKGIVQVLVREGDLSGLRIGLTKSKDTIVCEASAKGLAQMGERGLLELRKLAKSSNPRAGEAAKIGLVDVFVKKVELNELRKLAKDKNEFVREAAVDGIRKIKGRELLLGTRKPFAATPHLPEVLKRAKTFNKIADNLKEEFGKGFTGIVVFGSTAKGHATPESDVDYAVIASNSDAAERFENLSKKNNLPLCFEHYVNPREMKKEKIAPLFYGLFFGDRKALKKAQKSVFKQLTPREWNRIRGEIFDREKPHKTAFKRLGIDSEREKQRLKVAAALRVPPPYKEMKKYLE